MKKNRVKKIRKPRIYKDKKGNRYIRTKGKKIRIKSKLSDRQLVKIIINNTVNGSKEIRKKVKRKRKTKKNIGELSTKISSSSFGSTPLERNYVHVPFNQPDLEKKQIKPLLGFWNSETGKEVGTALLTYLKSGQMPAQHGNSLEVYHLLNKNK